MTQPEKGLHYLEFMSAESKLTRSLLYVYRLSYRLATPSASFDKLVVESPISEDGMIEIDYRGYALPNEILDKIINKASKKFKLSKIEKRTLSISVYLGSSPSGVKK